MAVEKQVFRLQVAIDDVVRVQVVERERNLGRVELCDWVGKALRGVSHGGVWMGKRGRASNAPATFAAD